MNETHEEAAASSERHREALREQLAACDATISTLTPVAVADKDLQVLLDAEGRHGRRSRSDRARCEAREKLGKKIGTFKGGGSARFVGRQAGRGVASLAQ